MRASERNGNGAYFSSNTSKMVTGEMTTMTNVFVDSSCRPCHPDQKILLAQPLFCSRRRQSPDSGTPQRQSILTGTRPSQCTSLAFIPQRMVSAGEAGPTSMRCPTSHHFWHRLGGEYRAEAMSCQSTTRIVIMWDGCPALRWVRGLPCTVRTQQQQIIVYA